MTISQGGYTMNFEETINQIQQGSVVDFKEYTLDRHEVRKLTLQVTGAVVQTVFQANEKLSRDTLERYYGTELDEIDYLQLSQMNCPRVVVSLGISNSNVMNIKILILNKDYFKTNLQEITVTNEYNINQNYNNSYSERMAKPWKNY